MFCPMSLKRLYKLGNYVPMSHGLLVHTDNKCVSIAGSDFEEELGICKASDLSEK